MSWDCMNCERANLDRVSKCAHCDEPRPDRKVAAAMNTCARCGTESKSVSAFHPDDSEADPADRGLRLCGGCWIPALHRRAEQARCDRCGQAGKCAHVQTCMAEFREYGRRIEARILSNPGPDEALKSGAAA